MSHFSYIYYQIALWTGYVVGQTLDCRPISVVVSVPSSESDSIGRVERNANLPTRVNLVRYVQPTTSFPINKLRNMAYQNSKTTHVVILDRDIIPARANGCFSSSVATLYSILLSLPASLLEDEKLAIVLPLFEMTHYNVPCSDWFSCDKQ